MAYRLHGELYQKREANQSFRENDGKPVPKMAPEKGGEIVADFI